MRPERPARLTAILSPWLLLACSSSQISSSNPSGNGGNSGTAGSGGGGLGAFLSTGQSSKPDADLGTRPRGCGDGILTEDEACDDHNTVSNDGCSADCRRVELGYSCPAGQACHQITRCGDGVKVPPEQCDDGNRVAGDGCSPACQIEFGYKCSGSHPNDPNDPSTSACTPTTCGDGKVEGTEGCDDGNTMPFDGCSADCQNEPNCEGDSCTSRCGDGIVLGEDCDDGNNVDGDGCSKDCKIERGWDCKQPTLGDRMMVPVIYRDFRYQNPPEFGVSLLGQDTPIPLPGIVEDYLDADGKPVYKAIGSASNITSADTFAEWYRDVPGVNHATASKLALWNNGQGDCVNHYGINGELWPTTMTVTAHFCGRAGSEAVDANGVAQPCTSMYGQTDCDKYMAAGYTMLNCYQNEQNWNATLLTKKVDGNPLFFPVDDDLFTPLMERSYATIPPDYDPVGTWPHDMDADGNDRLHNFGFTSEVRYWFLYNKRNSYRLDFLGNDDVWVFINKRLAIDLGGVHAPVPGSVKLDATTASSFGLADGNLYEIAVFQTQRQTTGSSYKLTLSGFSPASSECTPKCGDGIVVVGEECDDGVNDGGYGQCGPGCKLGGYCGDGIVQPSEDCDDGVNDGHPCPSGCRNLVAD
jgi:fibro-slime domain-containing protein